MKLALDRESRKERGCERESGFVNHIKKERKRGIRIIMWGIEGKKDRVKGMSKRTATGKWSLTACA